MRGILGWIFGILLCLSTCTVGSRMIVSKMDDIVQQLVCPRKMGNALTVNDNDFKRILTLL